MANGLFEVECPCCQAVLKIDPETRAVIAHTIPEKPRMVEDLAAAGLSGFAGDREVMDGRVYVSLASLEPALRYEVDERGLALRLTARPEILGRSAFDLRPTGRPPGLEAQPPGTPPVPHRPPRRSTRG